MAHMNRTSKTDSSNKHVLKDRCFVLINPSTGDIEREGVVLGVVGHENALVEFYVRGDGTIVGGVQRLLPAKEMYDLTFYDADDPCTYPSAVLNEMKTRIVSYLIRGQWVAETLVETVVARRQRALFECALSVLELTRVVERRRRDTPRGKDPYIAEIRMRPEVQS